jgi:hypothetical protein
MRRKPPAIEQPYRVGVNVKIGKVSWPIFAVVGGLGTGLAWLVVVQQDPATRYAGLAWLAAGFVFYYFYRRRLGIPLRETVLAPLQFGPAVALEYRSILVPIVSGREAHEAIDLAARLAAERSATIVVLRVIVVPLHLRLDTEMAAEEAEADRLRRVLPPRRTASDDRPRGQGEERDAIVEGRRSVASPRSGPGSPRSPAPRNLLQDLRLRPQERALPGHGGREEEGCVRIHTTMTQVLSLVIAALGVALLVRTLAAGGGQVGILIGLLFLGLGAGRFYLSRKAGG